MSDIQLKNHIIIEYPQSMKYTVLFREGGIQNFCAQFNDLPQKLQNVISKAKAEGRVHTTCIASEESITRDPSDMQGYEGFVVNVYSDMF